MHILITGGTGLIGSELCHAFLLSGHQLTILSRHPSRVQKKWGDAIKTISRLSEWDETTYFDAVINLAGEPIIDASWSESRKKLLWDSRVTLTEELVRRIATCLHKPAVLLSGSAIGYYGDRGDESLTESSSAGTDFAAQLCVAWESAANRASEFGVRVCLLRTGLVLSSKGGLLKRMVLPFKLGLGARLGNGKQWMSWICIDDYVSIVLKLIADADATGAYNMTSPHPETNRVFTAQMAHVLHRPAWFVAPSIVLKTMLGSRSVLLLGGQKVLPAKLSKSLFRFTYEHLDSALKACCYQR